MNCVVAKFKMESADIELKSISSVSDSVRNEEIRERKLSKVRDQVLLPVEKTFEIFITVQFLYLD